MKQLVALVTLGLLGAAVGEAPYPPSGSRPQGALLVLPPRQSAQYSQPDPLPPQVVRSVSLDRIGELITERLRQAEGSQNGNYYVSHPDGRLQAVQYSSAPLKLPPVQNTQQFNYQNAQAFGSTVQVSQQNSQSRPRFQGYTQSRPGTSELEESTQAEVRAAYSQKGGRFGQQRPAAGGSERYTQQDAAQFSEGAASNQHSESVPGRQAAAPTGEQPESSQQDPASAQQDPQQPQQVQLQQAQLQQVQLQQAQLQQAQLQQAQLQQAQLQQLQDQQQWTTASYVASVQYADVQPIAAPIYYAPAPLLRILRNAPKY